MAEPPRPGSYEEEYQKSLGINPIPRLSPEDINQYSLLQALTGKPGQAAMRILGGAGQSASQAFRNIASQGWKWLQGAAQRYGQR